MEVELVIYSRCFPTATVAKSSAKATKEESSGWCKLYSPSYMMFKGGSANTDS